MKGGWLALCVDSQAVPYQALSLFSAKFLSRHATGETHCSIAPSYITAKKINNSFHVRPAFRLSHDPKARLVVSSQFVWSNAIICSSVIVSLILTLMQCPALFFLCVTVTSLAVSYICSVILSQLTCPPLPHPL